LGEALSTGDLVQGRRECFGELIRAGSASVLTVYAFELAYDINDPHSFTELADGLRVTTTAARELHVSQGVTFNLERDF